METHEHVKTLQENRRCSYCNTEENTIRPVGQYLVKLKNVEIDGTVKLACQTCNRKQKEIIKSRTKALDAQQEGLKHLKKFVSQVMMGCFLLLMFSTLIMAQPGLPSAPSQAPIDGGLSLLAAAGGAYAIKKLRGKSHKA